MENVIYEQSPLAECLEDGIGDSGVISPDQDDSSRPSLPSCSFAPRGLSRLQSRIRNQLLQPLRVGLSQEDGFVDRVCHLVLNAKMGHEDNEKFLEKFRYAIVVSQLLRKTSEHFSFSPSTIQSIQQCTPEPDAQVAPVNVRGTIVIGVSAFLLAWILHWTRDTRYGKGRILLVLIVSCFQIFILYSYFRWQILQSLRQRALKSISTFTINLQAYESSTASALALIQEVELVSRGYRISNPLPPITRLEEKSQTRRCVRLRRSLQSSSTATANQFAKACKDIQPFLETEDLEKYLDIYDIDSLDLLEAMVEFSDTEIAEHESLNVLHNLRNRVDTLKRTFLCSLLVLEADGSKLDLERWTNALKMIENLASVTGDRAEKLNKILAEEDQFSLPPQPKLPSSPGRDRIRSQVSKINSLSQGLRALLAKIKIIHDETSKSIEAEVKDVTELSSCLMAHYESIDADLNSLLRTWEEGKANLSVKVDHERRISQASSGLRSPVPSLGGLTVVEEGTPCDALRTLSGDPGPTYPQGSPREDTFEGTAITPWSISRSKKRAASIAKLQGGERGENVMLRELRLVINAKGRDQLGNNRITSL